MTNFVNEWLAFLLGILVIASYLFLVKPKTIKIPAIIVLPISLVGLVLVQMLFNTAMVFSSAHLAILYLIWAAFLLVVVANIRDQLGVSKISLVLSGYFVAGGFWNFFIEFRHFGFSATGFQIQPELMGVGSLGQRNHLCDYVFLSSCSLLYLFARNRVGWWILSLGLLFFTAEMTLSTSRTAFLYFLAGAVLIAFWRKMQDKVVYQRLFKGYLLFAVLFIVWQSLYPLLVQAVQPLQSHGGAGVTRLIMGGSSANTPSVRLFFWQEAWEIFLQAPWLGVGVGEYDWAFFMHSQEHSHALINNHIEHAHNLFLHIMSEMGLAGLLCVLICGGLWLKQVWQTQVKYYEIGSWWLCALLITLGIHSMLEYPLWYSHFLGVFAIILGCYDSRHYTLHFTRLMHGALCFIPVFALYLLIDTGRSFLILEKYYEAARLGHSIPGDGQEVVAISNGGLLKPYGMKYFAVMFKLESAHADERATFTEKAMHFEPIPPLVYKQAAYLAFDDKPQEALQLFHRSVASYPTFLPDFVEQINMLPQGDQDKLAFLFDAKTAELVAGH
ncbi:Wzy polymerase domain-containing protein [Methylomonas sp. AM2-LC]|uniref:PglL family O-oligosaccharyltransferase n=1 Tax=Methylomonas sp. AM2-LC TaxID=3153301 RepID=UPI003265B029